MPLVPSGHRGLPGGSEVSGSWNEAWQKWRGEPSRSDFTADYVRECLKGFRMSGDPRFLGFAGAALKQAGVKVESSTELSLLRALVKQSHHDFEGAEVDLEAALRLDSSNGEAWLVRSVILQVQGKFEEARRIQWQVLRFAPGLPAVTSAAQLASMIGRPMESLRLLEEHLDQARGADPLQCVWAHTVAVEIAGREGLSDLAAKHFKAGSAIAPTDPQLLVTWADHLLNLGEPAQVLGLLAPFTRNDALALRLLLAARKAGKADHYQKVEAGLRRGMESAARRGDETHLREAALFKLHIEASPAGALELARKNWRIQRETADLHLLLSCAVAAGDAGTAGEVLDWMKLNGFKCAGWTALVNSAAAIAAQHKGGGVL